MSKAMLLLMIVFVLLAITVRRQLRKQARSERVLLPPGKADNQEPLPSRALPGKDMSGVAMSAPAVPTPPATSDVVPKLIADPAPPAVTEPKPPVTTSIVPAKPTIALSPPAAVVPTSLAAPPVPVASPNPSPPEADERVIILPGGRVMSARGKGTIIAGPGSLARVSAQSVAIVLQGASGVAGPGGLIIAELGAVVQDAGGTILRINYANAWAEMFINLPN